MLKERTRRLVHGAGVMTVARIELGYDTRVKTSDIFPGPHRPAASSPLILPYVEGKSSVPRARATAVPCWFATGATIGSGRPCSST